MKKLVMLFAVCLIIGATILTFNSCRKEMPAVRETSTTDNSSITIGKQSYKVFNTSIDKIEYSGKGNREASSSTAVKTDLEKNSIGLLFANLKLAFSGDIRKETIIPQLMVFYIDNETTVDLSNPIVLSKIRGVSFFTKSENYLIHKFYSISNLTTTIDSRLTSNTNTFTYEEIQALGKLVFGDYRSNILIVNDMSVTASSSSAIKFNGYGQVIVENSTEINAAREPGGECGVCGGNGMCQYDTGWWCYEAGPGCLQVHIDYHERTANGGGSGSIDLEAGRSFKANFMMNYQKGVEYIGYYYKVSYIALLYNPITASNLLDHVSLAVSMTQAAMTLMNGGDSEIPVDSALRDRFKHGFLLPNLNEKC